MIKSVYLIQNLKNKFRVNSITLLTKLIANIYSQMIRLAIPPINKPINILYGLESVFFLMLYTLLVMITITVDVLILIGYIIRTMRR